jgi:hypothetical protein
LGQNQQLAKVTSLFKQYVQVEKLDASRVGLE